MELRKRIGSLIVTRPKHLFTVIEGVKWTNGYKSQCWGCAECNYIGQQHLCACMGQLGQAIKVGDLGLAESLYDGIVERANADQQAANAFATGGDT